MVVNIGNAPPYLVLKSTSEKKQFVSFQTFQFFFLTFQYKFEASTAKSYAECFSVILKITKKIEKLRALYRIVLNKK